MIKVNNINCKFLEIDSDIVNQEMLEGRDAPKIELSIKKNCCSNTIKTLENQTVASTDIIDNNFGWKLDFSTILYSNNIIKNIYVQNITTGEVIGLNTGDITLDNAYFNTNNELSNTDKTTLNTKLDAYFDTLLFEYVGSKLYMSLESNNIFIPFAIEYHNTLESVFEYFYFIGENSIIINNNKLYIKPTFFSNGLTDGIYTVNIKIINPDNSYLIQEICIFVDCNIKCQIAQLLDKLIKDDVTTNNLYLIHYALINASNCGCNCEEMCDIFKYLTEELKNFKIEIHECTTC